MPSLADAGLEQTVRIHDNRRFVVVCGCLAIHTMALMLGGPLVPQYAASMGASASTVGIMVALGALIPVGISIPAGFLADRVGPLSVMFWGLLANCLSYFVVAARPSMAFLGLGQVLLGFSSYLVVVSGQAFVASSGTEAERQTNFGTYAVWVGIGNLAGVFFGGWLASLWGFRSAFGLAGALTLAAGMCLRMVFHPGSARTQTSRNTGFMTRPRGEIQTIRKLLSERTVCIFVFAMSAFVFAKGARGAIFPVFLRQLGYSPAAIGVLLAIASGVASLMRYLVSWVSRGAGSPLRALSVVMGITAVGMFLGPAMPSALALGASSLLVGIGDGLVRLLTMSEVSEHSSQGEAGVAMGIRMTGINAASFVSPLFFGFLAELTTLEMALYASAGSLLLIAIMLIPAGRGLYQSGRPAAAPL